MTTNQNPTFTSYLEAAEQMNFDGDSFIDGDRLYLHGDACRLAYEDIPDDLACVDVSLFEIGDEIRDPELLEMISQIKWQVDDLGESVPAMMVITADHELWMQGPLGCGMCSDDDVDGWLLFPVQMRGLDDFKRLYPLVIDVLCTEERVGNELKEKSEQLYALVKELECVAECESIEK